MSESEPLFVLLGMDPVEYELRLLRGRAEPGWKGMDASVAPRWHASYPLRVHAVGRL